MSLTPHPSADCAVSDAVSDQNPQSSSRGAQREGIHSSVWKSGRNRDFQGKADPNPSQGWASRGARAKTRAQRGFGGVLGLIWLPAAGPASGQGLCREGRAHGICWERRGTGSSRRGLFQCTAHGIQAPSISGSFFFFIVVVCLEVWAPRSAVWGRHLHPLFGTKT